MSRDKRKRRGKDRGRETGKTGQGKDGKDGRGDRRKWRGEGEKGGKEKAGRGGEILSPW